MLPKLTGSELIGPPLKSLTAAMPRHFALLSCLTFLWRCYATQILGIIRSLSVTRSNNLPNTELSLKSVASELDEIVIRRGKKRKKDYKLDILAVDSLKVILGFFANHFAKGTLWPVATMS